MGIVNQDTKFNGFFSPFSVDNPNRVVITNNQGYAIASDVTYQQLLAVISGGGTLMGADNGLHVVGSVVKLGGSLLEDTTINFNSRNLLFTNIPANSLTDFNLTIDSSGNIRKGANTITGTFILNQQAINQDASFSINNKGHIGGYGANETFISPTITGHQGYAWDGTYHYITDTNRIDKRNNDGTWSIALSNASPFTGVAGVNHLGDLDYYAGVLYIPAETFGGCGSVSGQKILTFNSTTLALINQFDISAQGHEASAIAIDSVNNIAYVSSYCDGSKLWKYNATTFAFLGVLPLSTALRTLQGISYENGVLYLASQQDGLYSCNPLNGIVSFILAPQAGCYIGEGISVVSGVIRWLIDNNGAGTDSNIRFYTLNSTPQGFYSDVTGISYFGSNLNVGGRLSINSIAEVGTINITGNDNIPKIYLSSNKGDIGSIGHDVTNTYITKNAYYLGGWQRPDITKNSTGFFLNDISNRFEFRYSAASVGLTWANPMIINANSGKITISNTTEGVFNGTGSVSNDQMLVIKNLNSLGASSFVATDDTGSRFMTTGVINSASTIGSSHGLVGEGYIRSSTGATGFHITCVTGPIRFSTNGGTEAMRIFQATRNITIGGTTDATFKLDVIGSFRANNATVNMPLLPANATTDFDVTIDASGNLRKSSATIANSYILNQTAAPQASSVAWLGGGAEALKVGTNTGNPDNAFIGLYARTATPTIRSGYVGYNSIGTTDLTVSNALAGNIFISLGAANQRIQLDANNIRIAPQSADTIQNSILLIQTSTATFEVQTSVANGATFRGVGYVGPIGAKTPIVNGTVLCRLLGSGFENAGTVQDSAIIRSLGTETWAPSTNRGSKWEFYTTPNATITQALAMTIDQDKTAIHFGGIKNNIRTISATTTALVTDWTILCDATSGAITLNLPSAASAFNTSAGQVYNIKKINNTANNITIDPNGAELIDNAATFVLSTYLQVVTIQSNGTSWYIAS